MCNLLQQRKHTAPPTPSFTKGKQPDRNFLCVRAGNVHQNIFENVSDTTDQAPRNDVSQKASQTKEALSTETDS